MTTTTTNARPSWQSTWLTVATAISLRSRCSRAQMGAVVVSKDQRVCATGYNGPSASWPESGDCIDWCPRARGESPLDNIYDQCPSIHAEANALLYVDRSSVEGGTIYITSPPCMQCAKLITNSGLLHVVCYIGEHDMHRNPLDVVEYIKKCGISVTLVAHSE
jgi:dCMP deaminase